MSLKVLQVEAGSIAAKKKIEAGDELTGADHAPILDYIDYAYYMGKSKFSLQIKKQNGKEKTVRIKKPEGEDIGLTFVSDGLEKKKHCRNKCVFCFVDQLPKGMRETLYFKDDDWRFSFLMGNYITLSNMTVSEMLRIVEKKISPLYISVHATNDDVRAQLLQNPKAKGILSMLKLLTDKGITVHAQAVVCPGINDGAVLRQTMEDLFALYPGVKSFAAVPVGLTQHRAGLPNIAPFDQKSAADVVELVEGFAVQCKQQQKTSFAFCADEFYIKAKKELPDYNDYEDFLQIENGVGLIRKFQREIDGAYDLYTRPKYRAVSVVTGTDFYPYLKEIAKNVKFIYNIDIHVYAVQNSFFGNSITVSGLLSARDVIASLRGCELGEKLFLPAAMFREFSTVTLDDRSVEDIEHALDVPCEIVHCDGYDFLSALCEEEE